MASKTVRQDQWIPRGWIPRGKGKYGNSDTEGSKYRPDNPEFNPDDPEFNYKRRKENFLDFLNPMSDCKSWIYWIIIAALIMFIIFIV